MNLSTATPVEVDTAIFANLQAVWLAEDVAAHTLDRLHSLVGDSKRYGWARGERQGTWQMTTAQVLEKAEMVQAGSPATVETLGRYQLARVEMTAKLAANAELDSEYVRRGGWTRAYLVDNADGHVHNTTRCSSWRTATRYHWLTELSGQPESEIVELAGERACTICYPSAPVDVLKRPSKLEGPAQQAAREAAEQRAADKASREAAKAAKAIANPDGSPLQGKWGVVKTERSAWVELVDHLFWHRAYHYSLNQQVVDRLVAALAAKTGKSAEEIHAEAEKKIAAKAKREGVSL